MACVFVKQKSALEEVFSLVTVLPKVQRLTSSSILRKAGRLPVRKGLDLDPTEEGETADQSTGADTEPSTKLNT